MSLLIPLAITAMAQPSGRFLDSDLKNRTYLRSIPLLCLADTVSVIVHLMYFAVSSPVSFNDRFRTFLWERFELSKGPEEQLPDEGLQTLHDTSWMRWVFLGLGTVWPSLKLVGGLRGLPWTTAWGLMFLSSIVMTEVLIWCACRLLLKRRVSVDDVEGHAQHQLLQQPLLQGNAGQGVVEQAATTSRPPITPPTPHRYPEAMEEELAIAHQSIVLLGLLAHFGLLCWTAWDLKPEPEGGLQSFRRLCGELTVSAVVFYLAILVASSCWFFVMPILMVALVILAPPFLIFCFVCGRGDLIDGLGPRHEDDWMAISGGLALIAGYFGILRFWYRDDPFSFKWTAIDCSYLLTVTMAPLLLYAILYVGSGKSCVFGWKLALMDECHCLKEPKPDVPRPRCYVSDWACRVATISFSTVILFFLWYPLRYDPTHTYALEWTSAIDGS